jgi:CHASE3 domain sensor protein
MKGLRERRKYWLLAFALILIIVSDALTYVSMRGVSASNDPVEHAQVVLETIDALNSNISEAEASGRAFMMTGDAVDLAPFKEIVQEIPIQLANLRSLTLASASHQKQLDSLEPLIKEKLAVMADLYRPDKVGHFNPETSLLLRHSISLTVAIRAIGQAIDLTGIF